MFPRKQCRRWFWKNDDLLGQEIDHLLSLNLSNCANRSSSWSLSQTQSLSQVNLSLSLLNRLSLSLSNRPIIPKFTQLGIWVSYHRVLCFDFRGRTSFPLHFFFLQFFLFSFNYKNYYKKKMPNLTEGVTDT